METQKERWIHEAAPIGFSDLGCVKCAECDWSYYEDQLMAVSDDGVRLPKYCPHCGARMYLEE